QVSRQTESLVAVVRAVAKTSAGTGEVDTEIHDPTAGLRPGRDATVGYADAVGQGLIGAPAGRCTGHAVGGHPGLQDGHIHLRELDEPELPLLGHMILLVPVAAVGRSGDGSVPTRRCSDLQVSRQTESLVAVVRAVAKTSAGTGEVDTEI